MSSQEITEMFERFFSKPPQSESVKPMSKKKPPLYERFGLSKPLFYAYMVWLVLVVLQTAAWLVLAVVLLLAL